jgi:hypothetical protein
VPLPVVWHVQAPHVQFALLSVGQPGSAQQKPPSKSVAAQLDESISNDHDVHEHSGPFVPQ